MIQIAVLGYGTVGSGVVEVINTNHSSINKKAGEEINIKYVLDLRDAICLRQAAAAVFRSSVR